MKSDTYTKGILTIIAACLLVIASVQLNIIPTANAVEPVNPTPPSTMDVKIVGISTSDEMEVEIVGVNTYDELPVNIDEVGGSSVSSGGPINVKMKN